MSPSMDRHKRAAGPSIAVIPDDDRPVDDGRPWRIRCTECERITWAETFRAAQNQIDTHQRLHHPRGAS